jgi:cell division protein FtsL
MALHNYDSNKYITQETFPDQQQTKKQSKKIKKFLSKGEKALLVVVLSVITLLAVMNIQVQSEVRSTSTDTYGLEKKIDATTKENTDLSIQVSELSTYERIWEKAEELGLKLNEQNIKVVTGQ